MAPMELHGVKGLVDGGISKVPDDHVSNPDLQSLVGSEIHSIPVIDLSDLQTAEGKQRVIQELRSACADWGFFQLIGHGFPIDLMENMMNVVHEFFELPFEERVVHYSEDLRAGFRFGTSFAPSKEEAKLWQDFIQQVCSPACDSSELPSNPPSYKQVSVSYGRRINNLAKLLLGLFSEALDLETSALEVKFAGDRQSMRMNYYPPCPEPDRVLGLKPHSDPNAFTILQQKMEGLQVLHEGAWQSIKPLPGAFVVNVGDQLQILSNDLFKSIEHRAVVSSARTRVSIASFYGPSEAAVIGPMPQLVTQSCPALYKECVYREYLTAFYATKLNRKTALDNVKFK